MRYSTRRAGARHAGIIARAALLSVTAVAQLAMAAGTASRAVDSDGDGVNDVDDNCLLVSNTDQLDTDGDNFGNHCDADLNNDLIVNFADLAAFKSDFLANGQLEADFNGDGIVNFSDLAYMKSAFLQAPGPSGILTGDISVHAVRRFASLSFSSAVAMLQHPNDAGYWYVVKQAGEVHRFANVDNVSSSSLVVDIRARVAYGGEAGLLGMAFHPGFATNGYVYLSYTRGGSPLVSYVSRFHSPDNGATIDPASEVPLLTINQPYANHNGGNIAFGPDGYLYAGFGDGGSYGDPQGNAQNTNTLLGAMLRIDINVSAADWSNGVRYYIPPDNPFAGNLSCVGSSGCPEIFAWGLRNPWRWSFDEMTGTLWVGDVGQNSREEVNIVVNGGNYGWRCYEGNSSYNSSGCGPLSNYDSPEHEYSHSVGNAVAGGYVYRGSAIPALYGVYLFADISAGKVWGITPEGSVLSDTLIDESYAIPSFAQGHDGEIYLLNMANGGIYRIEAQ